MRNSRRSIARLREEYEDGYDCSFDLEEEEDDKIEFSEGDEYGNKK